MAIQARRIPLRKKVVLLTLVGIAVPVMTLVGVFAFSRNGLGPEPTAALTTGSPAGHRAPLPVRPGTGRPSGRSESDEDKTRAFEEGPLAVHGADRDR